MALNFENRAFYFYLIRLRLLNNDASVECCVFKNIWCSHFWTFLQTFRMFVPIVLVFSLLVHDIVATIVKSSQASPHFLNKKGEWSCNELRQFHILVLAKDRNRISHSYGVRRACICLRLCVFCFTLISSQLTPRVKCVNFHASEWKPVLNLWRHRRRDVIRRALAGVMSCPPPPPAHLKLRVLALLLNLAF